jgi:predicted GIY-YIG superfamily endonuclease
MALPSPYLVYVLGNGKRTYVGCTNNFTRRLRQHNGELVGGAKATRGKGPWRAMLHITGFQSNIQALQFEFMVHHARPQQLYSEERIPRQAAQLHHVLRKERWTTKSPLASSVPLRVTCFDAAWKAAMTGVSWPDHVHVEP